MGFEFGEAGTVAGGFPVAGGIAPEKDGLAVAFAGLGNLVEDEEEMTFGGHHALAAGLFAEA